MKSLKKKICVSVFLDELFELVDDDNHDFIGGGFDGKEGDHTTAKIITSANSELVHSQEEEILFQRVSRPRKYRNAWRMSQRDQINFRNQLQKQLEGSSDWLSARAPEKVDRATDPRKEEEDTQNDYDVDEYTESDLNLELESLEEEKETMPAKPEKEEPQEKRTVEETASPTSSVKSPQSTTSQYKTKDARTHSGKRVNGSTQTEGSKNQVGTQVKMGSRALPSPGSRSATGPGSRSATGPGSRSATGPGSRILSKGKDLTKAESSPRRPRGGTAPPKADIDIVRDVKKNKKCFLVARCAKSTNLTGKYHKSTQFNLGATCMKPDMTGAESSKEAEKRLKAQCEALYEPHHQDGKLEELFHYMSSRKTVNVVKRVHHMTTKRVKEGAVPKKGPDRLNPRVSSEPTIGNAVNLWDGGGPLDKWDGTNKLEQTETDATQVIKKGFCDVTVKTFAKKNREQYLCYTLSIPWEITTLGEVVIQHHAFKNSHENEGFDTTNLFRSSRMEKAKELEALLLGTDCDKSFRYSGADDENNPAVVGISIKEETLMKTMTTTTSTPDSEKQNEDEDQFPVLMDISEMDGETHIEVVCEEDIEFLNEEIGSIPYRGPCVKPKEIIEATAIEEIETSEPDSEAQPKGFVGTTTIEEIVTSESDSEALKALTGVVESPVDSDLVETVEKLDDEKVQCECESLIVEDVHVPDVLVVEEESKDEDANVAESAKPTVEDTSNDEAAVETAESYIVEEVPEDADARSTDTLPAVEITSDKEMPDVVNETTVESAPQTVEEVECGEGEVAETDVIDDKDDNASTATFENAATLQEPLVEDNSVAAEAEAAAVIEEPVAVENLMSFGEEVIEAEEETVKTVVLQGEETSLGEAKEKTSVNPDVDLDSISVDYSEKDYIVSTQEEGESTDGADTTSLKLAVKMEIPPEDPTTTEAKETMTDMNMFDVKQELCLNTDKSVNTELGTREARNEEVEVAVQWELEIEIQNESESTQMIPLENTAEKDSEMQIIRALEDESKTNVILLCQTPFDSRFPVGECSRQSTCLLSEQVEQCYLKDEKIRKMYLANVPRHLLHATEQRLKEVGRG